MLNAAAEKSIGSLIRASDECGWAGVGTVALQTKHKYYALQLHSLFQLIGYDDEITNAEGFAGSRCVLLHLDWTRYVLCGCGYDQGFANLRATW